VGVVGFRSLYLSRAAAMLFNVFVCGSLDRNEGRAKQKQSKL